MNIQVNTAHNIKGSAELNNYIEETLSSSFERYNTALTRIEVHLSDENGSKDTPNDKRCLLEARLSNHKPVTVTHHADTINQAIEGASDKLLRSLDKIAGKMTDQQTSQKHFIPEASESSEEE